ncbi:MULTISPECIES: portal protein [Pseudomonas]|uniref:Head-tail connector protein n=1 Tax=Pseudomonas juntendi TaxID=2666183 RepID=A0A7W2R1N2_9PSED|nr:MULTISPECIES: portal protein [Pseudomonas]MBA6135087.1 head-tail connector protein [Pseudomonas juntendi]MBA6150763.1 head-tail connector protein [Pseudomonas juntendi]
MAKTEQEPERGLAASLYAKLAPDRETFLQRARDCSKYSIPTLIPPAGHASGTKFYTPWQAVAARGVNNLGAKLLMALLPPNSPFFRLEIDEFTEEKLTSNPQMHADVQAGLAKIERAVQTEIETTAIRVTGFELLKHLIVGGNGLVYLPQQGGMKFYPLDRYVVRRDPMGNVLDIVVKEEVSLAVLPEEARSLVEPGDDSGDTPRDHNKNVSIYTHITLKGETWNVYQEAKGQIVPGSRGTYPKDKCAWLPIRFVKIDGENYGRSYVEEYLGDIKSLEGLSQAIVEGSAASAKVLFLVNPNGVTSSSELAEAPNGEFVDGVASDVQALQLQKSGDFRVALETINTITERLEFAFMLNSAIQRNGERVTAEEIRYMAGELEAALGGVYSILSQEFQLPLVNRIMFSMQRRKKLPELPKGTVSPTIVTGMEALGRGNDLTKLDQFISTIMQIPDAASRINWGNYMTRRATALGIDTDGLVKTDQEVQQEQQQQQMQQAMQSGVAPAVQAAGRMMEKGQPDGSQAQT